MTLSEGLGVALRDLRSGLDELSASAAMIDEFDQLVRRALSS